MGLKRTNSITVKDRLTSLGLTLAVLLLCLFTLDGFCFWGDDHAAYLNQTIAMAEGRFEEQTILNYQMHPSNMVEEADSGKLVYVWAYSLILLPVYLLAGFDRTGYTSVIFYKLPSVLALAGITAILYLLLRRRLNRKLSVLLALLFGCCGEFFSFLDTLYSDLVFLFFALLCLYLAEGFWSCPKGKKRLMGGLSLGAALWFCIELRFNGAAILFASLVGHILSLWPDRKKMRRADIFTELSPYLSFGLLFILSLLLLPAATGNSSDLEGAGAALFFSNLRYYLGLIRHWLGLLINSLFINPFYSVFRRIADISYESLAPLRDLLSLLALALAGLGIMWAGLKKDQHLSLLVLVYIIVVSMLPYTQGLRYVYPLLPLILLFIGCALQKLWGLIPEKFSKARPIKALCPFIWAVLCFFVLLPRVTDVIDGGEHEPVEISSVAEVYMQNSYSPAAIEVYNFIQQETAQDSTIAFFAPRGLYLNTGRLGVKPGVNGHSMDEADYFLRYLSVGEFEIIPVPKEGFEAVFENEEFILYKRK